MKKKKYSFMYKVEKIRFVTADTEEELRDKLTKLANSHNIEILNIDLGEEVYRSYAKV